MRFALLAAWCAALAAGESRRPRLGLGAALRGLRGGSTRAALAPELAEVAPVRFAQLRVPSRRKKIRVLVLMSDTGGGHRASANALAQALDRRFPGEFEVSLFDIWGAAARLPFNKAVPVYRYMGRRPWLWRAFWYGTALWPARASARKGMEVQLGGRFRRALEPIQPDLVVSVHPMCQHVPLAALTAMAGDKGRIPFVTVVTDLNSAHPQWFDARVDAIFVPTERVAGLARYHGVAPHKIIAHGLPLRAQFCAKNKRRRSLRRGRIAARAKLGLKREAQTVLIVGGGDGVGGLRKTVDATARALARSLAPNATRTLVVVCGHNKELRSELARSGGARKERRDWASEAPGVTLVVKGFVADMHLWMAAADVLLTKAGPGTIAEAAAFGLPVLLTTFLPGQERGNVVHVVESGFGKLIRRPARAAREVAEWLDSPADLRRMSDNALASAKPLATERIAIDIAALAKRHMARQALA